MNHLEIFPKPCSPERPLPSELWPDMPGIHTAKVIVWDSTNEKWKDFCKTASNFPLVSVDTETSGLQPFHGSRIVGIAAAFYDGKDIQAGYWNFRHKGHIKHKWCKDHTLETKIATRKKCAEANPKWRDYLGKKVVDCLDAECPGYVEKAPIIPLSNMKLIEPVFEKCITAGQNFKYDCKMLSVDEVTLPEKVLDTMLIAHLWDETKRKYNLDILGKEIGDLKTGDSIKEYMEAHSLDVESHGHEQVPHEVESPYAVQDTVLVLRRLQWERQRWTAANDHRLMDVFQLENACTPAFARMEINGLKLDLDYVNWGIKRLDEELAGITKKIYAEAGREFDVMSTQQLWEVLESRGLKPLGTTPGGAPSLGATELEAYAAEGDAAAQMVLDYRSRYKILNTYLKPFRDVHADPNGFIHSDFFIHGTVSGRTSSREPNLQNISRPEAFTATNTMRGATAKMIQQGTAKFEDKAADKVQVRRCFIPRSKDYSLFFFDYSQMELRVFADYADEKFLLDALGVSGDKVVDIHELVAREIFPEFPDKDKNPGLYKFFRQLTKQINFGIIYGMGRMKLAMQLSVPVDEPVRLLKMVLKTAETNPSLAKGCCAMDEDEIMTKLEDHRVMSATRQWSGLRELSKDIERRVNPDPLAEYLFREGGNMGLMYSAQTFLAKYHARFPTIKKFTKGLETVVTRRGYIFNRYGRRYHLRPEESYIGVNRLVQGTTADQVKVADWRVDRLLRGTKSLLLNNVHDELQFDIHHSELHLVPKIKEVMEFYPNLNVKMLVEVDYAHTSWEAKTKWKGEEEFLRSLKEVQSAKSGKDGDAKGRSIIRNGELRQARKTSKVASR